MDEILAPLLHWIIRTLEWGGIAVIVVGTASATIAFLARQMRGGSGEDGYRAFRTGLSRAILLGLEFLVAADIINTVAIEPTLDSVAVLGGIVLIRTFLSMSLEVEIEGRWPWQRWRSETPDANGAPR